MHGLLPLMTPVRTSVGAPDQTEALFQQHLSQWKAGYEQYVRQQGIAGAIPFFMPPPAVGVPVRLGVPAAQAQEQVLAQQQAQVQQPPMQPQAPAEPAECAPSHAEVAAAPAGPSSEPAAAAASAGNAPSRKPPPVPRQRGRKRQAAASTATTAAANDTGRQQDQGDGKGDGDGGGGDGDCDDYGEGSTDLAMLVGACMSAMLFTVWGLSLGGGCPAMVPVAFGVRHADGGRSQALNTVFVLLAPAWRTLQASAI